MTRQVESARADDRKAAEYHFSVEFLRQNPPNRPPVVQKSDLEEEVMNRSAFAPEQNGADVRMNGPTPIVDWTGSFDGIRTTFLELLRLLQVHGETHP